MNKLSENKKKGENMEDMDINIRFIDTSQQKQKTKLQRRNTAKSWSSEKTFREFLGRPEIRTPCLHC